MSGFVALVAPPEGQVDAAALARAAAAIAPCGPDRQEQRHAGRAGLAHALLRQTFEDADDAQPLSLDGAVHLVGDVRLDGRGALIAALKAAGRTVDAALPDSALALHAYHVWGEHCPERLIGDFAFAVWDARARQIFAVRDQIGVVPLYYGSFGPLFGVANAVEGLLALPGVEKRPRRSAVADFLMFGHGYDPAVSFFEGIERLPPAHCLTVRDGAVRVRRYWTLAPAAPQRMAADDVIEQFRALLADAVTDRLRMPRVAISLSGGVDSTLVAAMAARHAPAGVSLVAHSSGCDWFVPDDERDYARIAADHLGIPFHANACEPSLIDPPDGRYWRDAPEPRFWMHRLTNEALLTQMVGEGARVMLTGHGGDALVAGGVYDWGRRLERGAVLGMIPGAWRYYRHFGHRPSLRAIWRRHRERLVLPPMRAAADPAFRAAEGLDARWEAVSRLRFGGDPRRTLAQDCFWPELLSALHPEHYGFALRARSPLVDIRLIEFVLRVPISPWQFDKALLRESAKGMLPDIVRLRRKTAYGHILYHEAIARGHAPWMEDYTRAPELAGIVDRDRFSAAVRHAQPGDSTHFLGDICYPFALAKWMRQNDIASI